MPFDPASFAVSAGTSALAPIIGKGLGTMFGLDRPSQDEEAAINRLRSIAGGVATSEDAMLAAQRAKTQSNLAALAARGTAQQQAGQTRMAMQMAPEVQQQQAANLAAQKSQRMQAAQQNLAQLQANMGYRNRQYQQGLIGSAVQGAAGAGAMAMMQNPDEAKPVAKKPVPPPPVPTASVQTENQTPYNQGAYNKASGQTQYNIPRPKENAGLVPMTAASQETANMARPSTTMGPEFDIGSSNQFTLAPDLVPAVGSDGGYRSPSLALGPKTPLAPSLAIGGKQRRSLYGYDPLAFQSQMKLGGY